MTLGEIRWACYVTAFGGVLGVIWGWITYKEEELK